jgi:hypothetical protein
MIHSSTFRYQNRWKTITILTLSIKALYILLLLFLNIRCFQKFNWIGHRNWVTIIIENLIHSKLNKRGLILRFKLTRLTFLNAIFKTNNRIWIFFLDSFVSMPILKWIIILIKVIFTKRDMFLTLIIYVVLISFSLIFWLIFKFFLIFLPF